MIRRVDVATLAADITTRRAAIAAVRAEADALIEQGERRARGWDRGAYRDDDTLRAWTIRDSARLSSEFAFHLSAKFAPQEAPKGWGVVEA